MNAGSADNQADRHGPADWAHARRLLEPRIRAGETESGPPPSDDPQRRPPELVRRVPGMSGAGGRTTAPEAGSLGGPGRTHR